MLAVQLLLHWGTFDESVVFTPDSRNFEHVSHQMTCLLHFLRHLKSCSRSIIQNNRVGFAYCQVRVASQRGYGHQLRVHSFNGFLFQLKTKCCNKITDLQI